jgi:hypothetical protein
LKPLAASVGSVPGVRTASAARSVERHRLMGRAEGTSRLRRRQARTRTRDAGPGSNTSWRVAPAGRVPGTLGDWENATARQSAPSSAYLFERVARPIG